MEEASNHGYVLEDLSVGMEASFEKLVDGALVEAFAKVSGDTNPVHLDEDYASSTQFKGRIAHGLLTASFISTVLGTKLPGPGAIYLKQSLRFRAPVMLGDQVTAYVKISDINEARASVTLSCRCVTANGVVLVGEAVMMVPRRDQV